LDFQIQPKRLHDHWILEIQLRARPLLELLREFQNHQPVLATHSREAKKMWP
jgi:hypothetical protein